MGRQLEETIDFHKFNVESSNALLARLIEVHGEPEASKPADKFAEIESVVEPILQIPSAQAAHKAWQEFIESLPRPKYPTVNEIKVCVVKHFNKDGRKNPLKVIDLDCARRTKDVVLPRQIAVYLAKQRTIRSLPEIGRLFGGRDHTTILAAVRKIERLVAVDPDIAEHVRSINEEIGA